MRYIGDKGKHSKDIMQRNEKMWKLFLSGIPKKMIAERFNMSMSHVCKILWKRKKNE